PCAARVPAHGRLRRPGARARLDLVGVDDMDRDVRHVLVGVAHATAFPAFFATSITVCPRPAIWPIPVMGSTAPARTSATRSHVLGDDRAVRKLPSEVPAPRELLSVKPRD